METVSLGAARFAQGYIRDLTATLKALSTADVAHLADTLWSAYQRDQQIFVLGNGGSAATASHLAVDLTKGTLGHRGDAPARPIRALSLTDNAAILTAWANDVGYESVFLGQLRSYLNRGDVVVAISASGHSENVLRAVRFAREVGATTIGLTGFGGGALAPLCDQAIVVESNHYGVVEDVQMQICHIVSYYLRERIAAQIRGPAVETNANGIS
jgi:D-sedoheptulose 7-phosphate isomerase